MRKNNENAEEAGFEERKSLEWKNPPHVRSKGRIPSVRLEGCLEGIKTIPQKQIQGPLEEILLTQAPLTHAPLVEGNFKRKSTMIISERGTTRFKYSL